MRVATWLLTAALCVLLTTGTAIADEDAAAKETSEALLAKALASGMDTLKLRVEAAMKRAALLEKAGKTDEALAIYAQVETMYSDGLKTLRELIAAARRPKAAPAGTPFVEWPEKPEPVVREEPVAPRPGGMPAAQHPKATDKAIQGGLAWLAANQDRDGSWRPDDATRSKYRPGVTALAVLAFLGAGYTHEGAHDYNKVVGKALDYLIGTQDPEGCFGARSNPNYVYNHAFATIAIAETYAKTNARLLERVLQKAMDFTALSRNPYFGWRYGVKPGDNDTSVTHWMLKGLHIVQKHNDRARAGGKAAPINIDEGAFLGAIAWVDKMTDQDYGRVGYVVRGTGPARPQDMLDKFPSEKSEAMTAAGINIRLMAGQDPNGILIQKGKKLLSGLRPAWNPTGGTTDLYYWYLGTVAMEQLGGRHWKAWRKALVDAVVPNQRSGRARMPLRGSWDPVGPWGVDGGRVYSTSILLLSLQVAQRSFAAER